MPTLFLVFLSFLHFSLSSSSSSSALFLPYQLGFQCVRFPFNLANASVPFEYNCSGSHRLGFAPLRLFCSLPRVSRSCCSSPLRGFGAAHMSKVLGFSDGDFCTAESVYANPKKAGLFLSLGRSVDIYFPACKRSRVSAPFVFSGERFEQKKKPSIDVLPEECLFEIFRRLPEGQERSACACVSKRWLSLLSDIRRKDLCRKEGMLSQRFQDESSQMNSENEGRNKGEEQTESDGHLSRTLEGEKATDVRLMAISVGTACHGGLGKLMVRGCNSTHGVTDIGLRAIARGCPSLKVLSLWNLPCVGDDGLVEIANGCSQLEKLDLRQCHLISDKALVSLAKNCPNLKEITIECCSKVGNEGLQAVGKFCHNLKSISIIGCPLVGDQGIANLLSGTAYAITKLKLQALNVSDVSLALIGHYGLAITDLVLTNLQGVSERGFWVMGNGQALQKLRSLAISSCQRVTDLGLEAIGKGCPNLKQLFVRQCPFLSDNGLVGFAKAASSFERLQLEECHRITQYGLFGLLNYSAKLKSLALVNCLGMKDFDLGSPELSPCGSMRSLTIRNCPWFGDASLAKMAKLCPQLQNVELNGLKGITDAGFVCMLESCEGGLGKVNISGCVNLTDKAVSATAELHGWTLEVLYLDGCQKIGDASMVAISQNCPLLNDLDISKCEVSDSGVAALAHANNLNLQILSMCGCSLISNKCVPALRKLGQSLVGLNLQHCNGLSSRSLGLLVEQLWQCDILY